MRMTRRRSASGTVRRILAGTRIRAAVGIPAAASVTATAATYPDQADRQFAIGRLGLGDGWETQNGGGNGCTFDKGTAA